MLQKRTGLVRNGDWLFMFQANLVFLSMAIYMMCRHANASSSMKSKEHSRLASARWALHILCSWNTLALSYQTVCKLASALHGPFCNFSFTTFCKQAWCYSWFQTFAVFWMLYAFFWVIPRRMNFIRRRFGTLCLFHLHMQVSAEWLGLRNVGGIDTGKVWLKNSLSQ